MPLTIVATAGSASANSFVTEAEQVAFMATRLNATSWTTVSGATCTETEKAAMIEASRELSSLVWKGRRADESQALSWPRVEVVNPDSPSGIDYDYTVIPQRVKDATAELAFQFVKAGTTDLAAAPSNRDIVSKTVGPISTTYSDPHSRPQGVARFPSVMRFLRGLLAGTGANSIRVVKG